MGESQIDGEKPRIRILSPNGMYLTRDPATLIFASLFKPDRQCAWCGRMMSGAMEGLILLQETIQGLRPYLVASCSHGICPTCSAKCRKQIQRRGTSSVSPRPLLRTLEPKSAASPSLRRDTCITL